jgi:hypothetical protein
MDAVTRDVVAATTVGRSSPAIRRVATTRKRRAEGIDANSARPFFSRRRVTSKVKPSAPARSGHPQQVSSRALLSGAPPIADLPGGRRRAKRGRGAPPPRWPALATHRGWRSQIIAASNSRSSRGAGSGPLLQRHAVDRQFSQAPAGGGEDRVDDRGHNGRGAGFAHPARRCRTRDDVDLNGRRLVDAQHWVGIEIGLLDATVLQGDLAVGGADIVREMYLSGELAGLFAARSIATAAAPA